MDESWRTSMGGGFLRHNSPRRQHLSRKTESDDGFYDVFGGPPRAVVDRRSAAGFYADVFSPPAEVRTGGRRNLPGFNIPPPNYNTTISSSSSSSSSVTSYSNRRILGVRTEDGFYDDIFGSSDFTSVATSRDRRSTTNSKSGNNKSRSNSSSSDRDRDSNSNFISSCRLGANRQSSKITNHDAGLSSFASKLRPITIPSRRHESSQPSILSSFAETDIYCPNCSKKATSVGTSSSIHNFLRSSNYVELEKKVVVEAKQELMGETEGASAVDEAIAYARERFWSHQQASDAGFDRKEVDYSEDNLSMEVPRTSDSTFSFILRKEMTECNGEHLKEGIAETRMSNWE